MGKKQKGISLPLAAGFRKSGSAISPDFRAAMDHAGLGALEVIRRHGIVRAPDEEPLGGVPKAFVPRQQRGPKKQASANPEIVAFAAAAIPEVKNKPTALIRLVALKFLAASVAEIRASLPDLNPSTVGIQVGKARRA